MNLLALALASSVLGYRRCDKEKYPFAGQNVTVPLVPSGTQAIIINNVTVPVQVAGSIRIVDGCTFEVIDYTLSGNLRPVWFGANGTQVNGYRLSTTPAPSSPSPRKMTFEFITTAGNWVSYYDFTQFRLYEETYTSLLATADLPARPATPTTPGGASTPGASPPGSTSNAESLLPLWILSVLLF